MRPGPCVLVALALVVIGGGEGCGRKADVVVQGGTVWTGLSTQHIRQGMEGHIGLDGLREVWMAISPVNYIEKFGRVTKKSKFIYTSYDTTFLPEFSWGNLPALVRAAVRSDEQINIGSDGEPL